MYVFIFIMYKQDKNNLPISLYPTCTFEKLGFLLHLEIFMLCLVFKRIDDTGGWIPGPRVLK